MSEPTLDELAAARAAGYQAGREGQPREAPGARHVPIPSLRDGGPAGDGQVVDALGMAWLEGWQDGARDGARLAGWLARMQSAADTLPFIGAPPWAAGPLTAGAWLDGWREAGQRMERVDVPSTYDRTPAPPRGIEIFPARPANALLPAIQGASQRLRDRLWADALERYKARHGLDNADLADRLHGTLDDVLRLAMCQRPDVARLGESDYAPLYWVGLAQVTTLSVASLRALLLDVLAEA